MKRAAPAKEPPGRKSAGAKGAKGKSAGQPARGGPRPWQAASRRLRDHFRRNAAIVTLMLEEARRIRPGWTPEELEAAGQSFFAALAIRLEDPKIWAMTQRLALQRDQLAFQREKFREQLRSKLELGLDALAQAFLDHPAALKLFRKARAMLPEATCESPSTEAE